jgi:uncharacterized membrane protein
VEIQGSWHCGHPCSELFGIVDGKTHDMTTNHPKDSHFVDLGRLTFLIDGVFAVVITILVLDLRLPDKTGSLVANLKEIFPAFLVYLLVFASIAGYWALHHGNFHYVAHGDGRLVVLSLINLLFVTLFPFAANIVAAYPKEPLATVCLSVNCMLYCFSSWGVWSYAASNPDLVANEADRQELKLAARIILSVAVGLAISIALAFITVYLAYAAWAIASVGWPNIRRRLFTRRPARTSGNL